MKKIALLIALAPVISLAQTTGELVDKIIGVVGDEIVLYSDIKNAAIEMNPEGGGKLTEDEICQSFENLMYQKLLLNQSRIDSVEVSDAEVQSQVERRLDYYVQMIGSVEEFEKYYGKTVTQMKDEYFDLIKEQILVQKEQEQITKSVKVTPSDVLNFYNSVPKDSLPLIGEQLQYSQIIIDPVIRESENQRVIHFMDSLRNDISAGRTSMTIQAARWSEDPGSKYKGGCYPLQRKGSFVPEYESAVFSTNEGSYSPVFKSEYGYHFVKVVEKRGEFYETCHILMSPKVLSGDLDRAKIKADSLYNAIKNDSLSFRAGATRFSTDKGSKNQEGRVMNPRTNSTKHDLAEIPADINLTLRDLQPGQFSEPVLITKTDGSKSYAIYKVDARMNAHRAGMEQDYELFQSRAEAEIKQKEIDKWVRKTLANTFNSMAPEYSNCTFQFDWNKNNP